MPPLEFDSKRQGQVTRMEFQAICRAARKLAFKIGVGHGKVVIVIAIRKMGADLPLPTYRIGVVEFRPLACNKEQ